MPTEDRNLPVGNSETRADEPAGVTYSMSGGLVGLLASLKISVAFSSYQSGKFYLLGRNPEGGLMVNEQFFRQAMGIHVSGGTIYLATLSEIVRLENVLEPNQRINDTFDACFVPRTAHVTGALDAHDLGIDRDGRILFVNTRFNCLSTISERHSFQAGLDAALRKPDRRRRPLPFERYGDEGREAGLCHGGEPVRHD